MGKDNWYTGYKMRNFIASMAMVSGVVVIVTTFNNGVSDNAIGGSSLKSSVNQQSFAVNTTPEPEARTSDIRKTRPVYNKVFDISLGQLYKKFDNHEMINFRDVKGNSIKIRKTEVASLAAGVYILRKNSRIYRYLKR